MKHTTILSIAAATLVALSAPAAGGEREETTQVYEVGKSARLSLSNLNGGARITAWDKSVIEVKATKSTRGSRENLEQVEVIYSMDNDYLRIETEYDDDDDWNDEGVSVDFDIKVPRSIDVENVKLVNGDLDIDGVSGEVDAASVNGDVNGLRLTGHVRLSTVNGDVTLATAAGHESIRLKSVNGSVELELPKNANAKLSASTVHGDIRGDLGHGVTHAGSSMDAVLGTGGPRIELGTVNGDIRIRRTNGGDSRKRDSDDDD